MFLHLVVSDHDGICLCIRWMVMTVVSVFAVGGQGSDQWVSALVGSERSDGGFHCSRWEVVDVSLLCK